MRQVDDIFEWKLLRKQKEYPSQGLTYALWETANEEFALYFYRIAEYGMMRTCSSLQLIKDKSNPTVVYDSLEVAFDCNIFDWSFLMENWTHKGYLVLRQLKFNPFREPIILIKLDTLEFASWDKFYVKYFLNNDNSITFDETFLNKDDNTKSSVTQNFKLNEIKWKPLRELR